MRKLIVSTYVTLDGKVDDLRDWVIPFNHAASARYHADLLEKSDGLLLGRKTYEIFAAIWPPRAGQLPYIDKINGMAKYVASSTIKSLPWQNSHRLEGDVPRAVAALKEQPGQDLVMYGSGDLMHGVMDLVDEYRLLVHPVLFGKGNTFFKDGAKRVNLELVDSKVIDQGVTVLTYQRRH